MGSSISCLQITFRSLQSTQPWLRDPDVVELPWRSEKEILAKSEAATRTIFGVFADDGIVTPHPPIRRAIRTVVGALQAANYQVRFKSSSDNKTVLMAGTDSEVESSISLRGIGAPRRSDFSASRPNDLTALQHCFTEADGAWDVFECLALSGEPLIPELTKEFGDRPKEPMSLLDYHENVLRLKEYRGRYQSYWNSTAESTTTGKVGQKSLHSSPC